MEHLVDVCRVVLNRLELAAYDLGENDYLPEALRQALADAVEKVGRR